MTCDSTRCRLKTLHDTQGLSWRRIAEMDEFKGLAPGTLCSFAKGNYEPKDPELRKRLGLPEIIQYVVRRNEKGRFAELE